MKKTKRVKGEKREWKPDGYIYAALRRIFGWSPAKREALKRAKFDEERYTCASCAKQFERKGVAVDHVSPVVEPSKGFEGWDVYISRLYCDAGNLQVLCRADHKIKTKQENALRKRIKKAA